MQTNQWFKLAILAFVGIILSSLSLSLITPATQQPAQNPAIHGQGAPGQHGSGGGNQNIPANYPPGGSPQLNQQQLLEMQYRLWQMQNNYNYMSGYGMPNGYMPVNPGAMPGMPGMAPYGYGYPGPMGGMNYPNPMNMYPNMNPNMTPQGSTSMPSGNSGSNSGNSMGGSSGGGMSMM